MKKIFAIILSILLGASLYSQSIGLVNTQEVLAKYSESKNLESILEKKKAELEIILESEKKKIEKKEKEAKEKGEDLTVKEKNELDDLKKTYQAKYSSLQTELNRFQYENFQKLKSDIEVAIKEVAKTKKLDSVMDSQVVYYGGTDITKEVIEFLSGVEKITLE